jgi:hypothetical protein
MRPLLNGSDAFEQRVELAGFVNRHDNHLDGGQLGWQHQAFIVGVGHY